MTEIAQWLTSLGLGEYAEAFDENAVDWDTLPELDGEAWRRVIDIDLHSVFYGCRAAIPHLRAAGGGVIVNTASISGLGGDYALPSYNAAKAGVVQMTKNLAAAWAGDGIRCNAVAPGLIESNMTRVMKGIEALEGPQIERTALKRWGTPEDIAPAVLFLASPAARFITGQTFCVDGGYSAL